MRCPRRANSSSRVSALAMLDVELQKQVLTNRKELLSQVTWVEKIEAVLAVMRVHVQVYYFVVKCGEKFVF